MTNIMDFGIFVKLGPGASGLVHRSELGLDSEPLGDYFEVGDLVAVEVKSYQNGRYSLALLDDDVEEEAQSAVSEPVGAE